MDYEALFAFSIQPEWESLGFRSTKSGVLLDWTLSWKFQDIKEWGQKHPVRRSAHTFTDGSAHAQLWAVCQKMGLSSVIQRGLGPKTDVTFLVSGSRQWQRRALHALWAESKLYPPHPADRKFYQILLLTQILLLQSFGGGDLFLLSCNSPKSERKK